MRDVNSGLDGAIRDLIAAAEPRDRAVHLLALRLATAIEEEPESLKDLAPKLLQVLDAIHATPKSRVAPKPVSEAKVEQPTSSLSRLRAAHGGDGS